VQNKESVLFGLAEALRAEVDAYIAAFADERDEYGRRLVVRNGSRRLPVSCLREEPMRPHP
jgi:hypothetical protein